MNFVSFKISIFCISFIATIFFYDLAYSWDVDFSRRQVQFDTVSDSNRHAASVTENQTSSIVSSIFEATELMQDIVILNTETGFIPSTIRFKKGNKYRVHVVNVNSKEKNVSFVMDAFSEHHNTIFGEEKSFEISPKADGIYSFQCPETAVQGKIVIFSDSKNKERQPASE